MLGVRLGSVSAMSRYVVTGGLGTGKTSVVSALASDFTIVAEPARELIAEHADATGESTLDTRPELFVERLIARSIAKYHSVPASQIAVFDRGLPDCVAYATVCGLDPAAALEAASGHCYEPTVFVTDPWKEIYTTDDMRRATFDQAEDFHAHVVAAYTKLGYELVELPKAPVAERAAFIRAHIG